MPNDIVDKYKVYRAEDKHECDLLSARVNALLMSQSLLATAAAILYANGKVGPTKWISTFGIIACFLAGIAISTSCVVLRKWHQHGRKLVQDAKGELDGYTYGRTLPDLGHLFSIEFFGLGLCVVFLAFWIAVCVALKGNPV